MIEEPLTYDRLCHRLSAVSFAGGAGVVAADILDMVRETCLETMEPIDFAEVVAAFMASTVANLRDELANADAIAAVLSR